MALEACMIIVDNSEWTRNGDVNPSRFQAQLDAVSIISRNKTGSNAETSVGIVDTTGPTCHMSLVTDADLEKLLAALHRIHISGRTNLISAVNVAMLALKHRINKRQEQRVIAFVASPISETEKELKTLGVRLKKNKVAIDIISFGEDHVNSDKLKALITAANNNDNSHYIPVEVTPHLVLTDVLSKTTVLAESMAGSGADDDLEMAIRLSLQEAQGGAPANVATGGLPDATTNPNANVVANEDEDALMAQAIAMSLGGAPPAQNQAMDIDEDMELAIRLSMQDSMDTDQQNQQEQEKPKSTLEDETKKSDVPAEPELPPEDEVTPEFLQGLVQNLEGVDPNDPNIKELLASLRGPTQDQEKKDEEKK